MLLSTKGSPQCTCDTTTCWTSDLVSRPAAGSENPSVSRTLQRTYVMSNSSESTSFGLTGPKALLNIIVWSKPASRQRIRSADSHACLLTEVSPGAQSHISGRAQVHGFQCGFLERIEGGDLLTSEDFSHLVLLQLLHTASTQWCAADIGLMPASVQQQVQRTRTGRLVTSQFDISC